MCDCPHLTIRPFPTLTNTPAGWLWFSGEVGLKPLDGHKGSCMHACAQHHVKECQRLQAHGARFVVRHQETHISNRLQNLKPVIVHQYIRYFATSRLISVKGGTKKRGDLPVACLPSRGSPGSCPRQLPTSHPPLTHSSTPSPALLLQDGSKAFTNQLVFGSNANTGWM